MEILKKTSMSFWGLGVFLLLCFLDQASKYFAKNIFYNSQFAFSLPLPLWLIYLIYAAILALIALYLLKHFLSLTKLGTFAWLLIISGALLNIGERLVLGSVRDFIYVTFYHWIGVYNLADGYIILGITLLLLSSANSNDKKNKI